MQQQPPAVPDVELEVVVATEVATEVTTEVATDVTTEVTTDVTTEVLTEMMSLPCEPSTVVPDDVVPDEVEPDDGGQKQSSASKSPSQVPIAWVGYVLRDERCVMKVCSLLGGGGDQAPA